MEITPAIPEDRQVIDSYGPGRFKIARTPYEGPVIVLPKRVMSWDVRDIGSLDLASLAPLLEAEESLDLLLIGTGERMQLVSPTLRAALKNKGIAVDFMATGAACRTFNVLLAEERDVAAALIPV